MPIPIERGEFSGDFIPNTNYAGVSNDGEIRVSIANGNLVYHPNGKIFEIPVNPNPNSADFEIGTHFEGSVTGQNYIMYIGQDFSRFAQTHPYSVYTKEFVYCRYQNGIWEYAHNSSAYYEFIPNFQYDCLVGEFEKTPTTGGLNSLTQYSLEYGNSAIEHLKTDWTPQDYYHFDDLNRVEIATLLVRDKIATLRGNVVSLEPLNTDRSMKTIEFADSLNRIEQNILRLKLAFGSSSRLNESKTDWKYNDPFDFSDANRLESDLYLMFHTIESNISSIPHCGQYIVGERGIY